MRQVGPARADVRTKYVAAVALVVHPARELDGLIGDLLRVAPDVYRHATDGRQEELQVHAREQLGVHGVGLLEDGLAQLGLRHTEALRDAGQVPHGLDGGLCHKTLPVLRQHGAVRLQAPGLQCLPALGQLDVRLRHCDRRTDIVALVKPRPKALRDDVAVRVNRDNPLWVAPAGERPDASHGRGHTQPRHVAVLNVLADPGQGPVDGIAAGVGPDGVALVPVPACSKHRPPQFWRRRAPAHHHRLRPEGAIVRRERRDAVVRCLHLRDRAWVGVGGAVAEDPRDGLVARARRGEAGHLGPELRRGGRTGAAAPVLSEHGAEDALGQGVACRRPKLPVTGVPQARHDVAVLPQGCVNGCHVDADVRMGFVQLGDARVGRHDAEDDDLRRAPTL
mmetsp:Transcript_88801/g.274924  ORF Transcript_88801/g.274924 Transcript_88801/m.274924 type:complete len:393 (-) Transcript_88801:1140-2318(-)